MMRKLGYEIFLLFIFSIYFSVAQYVPPQALVEPLKPIGIRISIPDEEGISLVAYHVQFNEEFYSLEAGTISVDIIKKRNGRWIYQDKRTKLKPGDMIYYWIHVVYNGLGYNLLDQSHKVTDFYNIDGEVVESNGGTSPSGDNDKKCKSSRTKLFDKSGSIHYPCEGAVVFQEDFRDAQQLNRSQWTVIEQFSDSPDYEFVVYRNSPVNVNVNNGLQITPRLLSAEYGAEFISTGTLSLTKCTGRVLTIECYREARGWGILPIVTSGRLNTKEAINFQYGRVEIKAKFPRGDWLYPVIALVPAEYVANSPLSNLQIRIASASGNAELKTVEGLDISGHVLWGGVTGLAPRHHFVNYTGTLLYPEKRWADDYHTYSMEWTPEKILLSVDGYAYKNEDFTDIPRDTPFYLTLGVAAGGVNEFPDNCGNQYYQKTWRNVEAKAPYYFWKSIDSWYSSWEDGATSLHVDYVKITAL